MDHTDAPVSATSPALSQRAFWTVYVAGWLGLLGLFIMLGLTSGAEEPGFVLGLALVSLAPPALTGAVVAANRGALLRPERSLARTVALHAAVGVAFAALTATLVMALSKGLGYEEPGTAAVPAAVVFGYRFATNAFFYVILGGFLMWTESMRRVHESRTMAAREAVLRAQAEAKALRAQFNPHFVFNTLHSLMLLVRADPATAERAIEDVATLIRYASILQRREVDVVPLAKELAVARTYVGLEKLRLEDRLTVEFEVEVEPGAVALPAFALQTLLENAIKHGLEPSPEGGTVRVGAARNGPSLVVTVADDGAGAEPDAPENARDHGLDLLRRRLAALHGEDASLSWTTAPGEGFSAVLTVPWQTAGAAGLETIPDAGALE